MFKAGLAVRTLGTAVVNFWGAVHLYGCRWLHFGDVSRVSRALPNAKAERDSFMTASAMSCYTTADPVAFLKQGVP